MEESQSELSEFVSDLDFNNVYFEDYDNQDNYSQLNSSQILTTPSEESFQSTSSESNAKSFVSSAYDHKGYDTNRNKILICRGCKKMYKTNRYNTIINHAKICCLLPKEIRIRFQISDTKKVLGYFDRWFCRILVKHNVSFRFSSDKEVRSFIKEVPKNWSPPNRNLCSTKHLSQISQNIQNNFYSRLNNYNNYILALNFDHWLDFSHRELLGISASGVDESKFLLALLDTSALGKAAQPTKKLFLDGIKKVPLIKINCIISDSASACKKAREELVELQELKHVIQYRCLAHLINNIGKLFCEFTPVKNIKKSANELATFFHRSVAFGAKLRDEKVRRVSIGTEIRWYYTADMLESLVRVREIALDFFSDEDNEARRLLIDQEFWDDVSDALRIIRPIANCIAIAERKDATCGEAISALLDYANSIFKLDWDDGLVLEAISTFLNYFNYTDKLNQDEYSIFLASYFLDKRNKMKYITKTGKALIVRALINVAKKSGYSEETIATDLISEFKAFESQSGSYSWPCDNDMAAFNWWQKQSEKGVLRQVAIRISMLKSSSAELERIFSSMKFIQSPSRTRLSLSNLIDRTRVKLMTIKSKRDIELIDAVLEKPEEIQTSIELKPYQTLIQSKKPKNSKITTRVADKPSEINSLSPTIRELLNIDSQINYEPKPDLLDERVRIYYDEFTSIIDFDLIPEIKDQPEPFCQVDNIEFTENILEKYLSEA